MNSLRNHKLIAHIAVFAVVVALLFFMTVRVSPIATDSSSLNKVNLKQRNLNIDAVGCVSLRPYVVSFVPRFEDNIPQYDEVVPSFRLDGQHFNRPPPAFLA